MPISTDSAKVSVDFAYDWENPKDGSTETYQMKFLHNEFGPVIHIFQGPYEPVELPASMFLEVAEFLVRQGVMKGMTSLGGQPKPAGALPVPSIGRKTPRGSSAPQPPPPRRGIGFGIQQQQQLAAAAESDPHEVGSLTTDSQEDAGAAQIAAVTAQAPDPPAVSPDDAKRLLQARLEAKAKMNATGKTIRKNPKYENGGGE
jgi:hypothetical protein